MSSVIKGFLIGRILTKWKTERKIGPMSDENVTPTVHHLFDPWCYLLSQTKCCWGPQPHHLVPVPTVWGIWGVQTAALLGDAWTHSVWLHPQGSCMVWQSNGMCLTCAFCVLLQLFAHLMKVVEWEHNSLLFYDVLYCWHEDPMTLCVSLWIYNMGRWLTSWWFGC